MVQRYCRMEDQKLGLALKHVLAFLTRILLKVEGLNQKLKSENV